MVMGSYGWDPTQSQWGFSGVSGAPGTPFAMLPTAQPTYGAVGNIGGAMWDWDPEELKGQLDLMPLESQYGRAARVAMPGFQANPYARGLLSRTQAPLMGQYALQNFTQDYNPSFQQWLMTGGTGGDSGGTQMIGRSALARGVPTDWEAMIRAARAGSAVGTGTDAWDRWWGTSGRLNPLSDLYAGDDFTALATYNPRAGSVYGQMQAAALNRKEQDFYAQNPLATEVDWLGYLTRSADDPKGYGQALLPSQQSGFTVPA
jgi:hypothetical protein